MYIRVVRWKRRGEGNELVPVKPSERGGIGDTRNRLLHRKIALRIVEEDEEEEEEYSVLFQMRKWENFRDKICLRLAKGGEKIFPPSVFDDRKIRKIDQFSPISTRRMETNILFVERVQEIFLWRHQ